MNHPQQENVITLIDDEGKRVAIIRDRKLYGLTELNDDKIAELFNGNDVMPIIPGVLASAFDEKEV